jgi:hypothetical protein
MAPRWVTDDGDGLDGAVDAAFGAAAFEDAAFEVDTERLRAAAARLTEAGLPAPEPPAPLSDQGLPAAEPLDAGLTGWSVGPVLARLDSSWSTAVSELAAEYADHADQLRAVADRYDDAERIVLSALAEHDHQAEPHGERAGREPGGRHGTGGGEVL